MTQERLHINPDNVRNVGQKSYNVNVARIFVYRSGKECSQKMTLNTQARWRNATVNSYLNLHFVLLPFPLSGLPLQFFTCFSASSYTSFSFPKYSSNCSSTLKCGSLRLPSYLWLFFTLVA